MNNADYVDYYGWNCSRVQTEFSNSMYSNLTPIPTTHSKGRASFVSDAGIAASGMVGNSPATGNPLRPTDYSSNFKWGNPLGGTSGKWTISRPDTYEARSGYEGELITTLCYLELLLLFMLI